MVVHFALLTPTASTSKIQLQSCQDETQAICEWPLTWAHVESLFYGLVATAPGRAVYGHSSLSLTLTTYLPSFPS